MKPSGISGQRLWESIMAMAKIGATEKGGSNRQALAPEDFEWRDLFTQWCSVMVCEIETGPISNMFVRGPGRARASHRWCSAATSMPSPPAENSMASSG